VDDLPLDLGEHAGRLVRTDGAPGLSEEDAGRLAELLVG
jgi:hypothetical protein